MQVVSSAAQIWSSRSPWLRDGSSRSLRNVGIRVSCFGFLEASPNRESNSESPNATVMVRSEGPTVAPMIPLSGGG